MTPLEKVRAFPSIVKLMDDGVQKDIDRETDIWNKRAWKGTEFDRFPLSPSQIGKCALALGRNLSHYLGVGDYPRLPTSLAPRTKRIFARGDLLEDALIADVGSKTPLKPSDLQRRVKLFTVSSPDGSAHPIEGNIDSILVSPAGVKILTDYKSKGAFYSAGFTDSIAQFFQELRTTGLVEEIHPNTFLITDAKALFDMMKMEEFFIDYLLQLNSYAFAEGVEVDFVALYYENKNTCANYEVRWVPHRALFDYARDKFQYIYRTVLTEGAEAIPKEFQLGSARCRLCDYNERCYGKYEPKANPNVVRGTLPEDLDRALRAAQRELHVADKVQDTVLQKMAELGLTHAQTSDGLTYERKFLKSPKPHFELRLSK
jgi:hypothetical protein